MYLQINLTTPNDAWFWKECDLPIEPFIDLQITGHTVGFIYNVDVVVVAFGERSGIGCEFEYECETVAHQQYLAEMLVENGWKSGLCPLIDDDDVT